MNKEEFESQYNQKLPFYKDLAGVVVNDLSRLVNDKGIAIFEVKQRIKELKSAFEKIDRKSYANPFDDIEDFCGVRIICYYQSDVEKICKIISENYNVLTSENTFDRLNSNEFGYRSHHVVIKIPDAWLGAPAYRKLNGLKAEIQIRTLLMHAWAEIQHKLAYKNSEQVPDNFRRKLFRLSAKFEEADEQFEEIRLNIDQVKKDAISGSGNTLDNLRDQVVNLDTVTLMLETIFPTRKISRADVADILDEIRTLDIDLKMFQLIDICLQYSKIVKEVESLFARYDDVYDDENDFFLDSGKKEYYVAGEFDTEAVYTAVGCLRSALDAFIPEYYQRNPDQTVGNPWHDENLYARRMLNLN